MTKAEELETELFTQSKEETPAFHAQQTPTEFRKQLIETIAEEIHPGCWDLSSVSEARLAYRSGFRECQCSYCREMKPGCTEGNIKKLVIKFPETIIRNSEGANYVMKDFYIAILLNKDYSKTLSTNMYSLRSTVTTKEYASGVFHPHSTTTDKNTILEEYFSWRDMCLGGDTELTDIMYTLFKDGVSSKPMHELLIMLHVYASWESIEGGPYRPLRAFAYPRRNEDSSSSFDFNFVYTKFIENLCNNNELERPEFIGRGNSTAITNTATSIIPIIKEVMLDGVRNDHNRQSRLLPYLGHFSGEEFTGLLSNSQNTKKTKDFYLERIEETKNLGNSWKKSLLVFRGETPTYVIEYDPVGLENGTELTPEMLETSTVHPNVVSQIVNHYIQAFNAFKQTLKF